MKTWYELSRGNFSELILNTLLDMETHGFKSLFPLGDASDDASPRTTDDVGMEPILLAYSPPARLNHFQALLYSRAAQHGFGLAPVADPAQFDAVPWLGRLVYHLHWLGNVVRNADNAADARGRIKDFLDTLDRLKDERQAKLVWTAHNVLPHDSQHRDLDLELRQELIDRCDAIHLLSENSLEALQEKFELDPARTFYAPHPSYEHAYPDFVSREQARLDIGVPADAYVFLFFGSMQKYKGLEILSEAFEEVVRSTSRPCRLVVAGMPTDREVTAELKSWAISREDVLIEASKIPSEQVQYYFRGSDATIIPYREALNSGVALLSLTFDTPVIAAAMGALSEFTGYGVASYDPLDENALASTMLAAVEGRLEPPFRVDHSILDALVPAAVSDAFFEGLMRALSWRRDTEESNP